jgi:hypothetical protein
VAGHLGESAQDPMEVESLEAEEEPVGRSEKRNGKRKMVVEDEDDEVEEEVEAAPIADKNGDDELDIIVAAPNPDRNPAPSPLRKKTATQAKKAKSVASKKAAASKKAQSKAIAEDPLESEEENEKEVPAPVDISNQVSSCGTDMKSGFS